jgi:CSLREA domain-containing protein
MRSFSLKISLRYFLLFALVCGLAALSLRYSPAASRASSAPAVKRGPATIVLQDSQALPATYAEARPGGAIRPTALVSADFDVDGYPDLVSAYADGGGGGYLFMQRGNPEAFAPTTPENFEAAAQNRYEASFLPDAKTVALSAAPDFVVAGDFDRDSNPDLIAAARGDDKFYLATGDGDGGFAAARSIALPGRVTALAAGQIDLTDNQDDLVVGVEDESGAALAVYESDGGVADAPLRYALPQAARSVVLGQLDDSPWADAAILGADGGVFVLHGRNQRVGRESAKGAAARLERVPAGFAAKAISIGDYIWDRSGGQELALLREDGAAVFLTQGEPDTRPFTVAESRERRRRQLELFKDAGAVPQRPKSWRPADATPWLIKEDLSVMEARAVNAASDSSAPVMFSANLSGQAAADLVVLDGATQQLKIFAVEAPPKQGDEVVSFAGPRAEMALPAGGAPVAALAMRTTLFVRPGLVYLRQGGAAPEIIPSAPSATFTVTKAADTNDGACTAGDCSLREAHVAANGAAGADIITIPNNTYTLTIANVGGNDDGSATGDLDVNEAVTLNGAAAATTIVQAGTTNANGIDKVMGLNPICTSPVAVTMSNLTVRFGRNTNPAGSPDFSQTGGGMDFCPNGGAALSISNSTITDNSVANSIGGGLNASNVDTGPITLTNVTISNNRTLPTSPSGQGGGLMLNTMGNATITNSVISGNMTAGSPGGGICNQNVGGAVLIQGTTISGNTAATLGGGVYNTSSGATSLTINQASVISGNTSNGSLTLGAGGEGGGFSNNTFSSGTTTITGSTIINNTTAASATPRGGGGLAFHVGNATVSFCRIFGNTSSGPRGIFVFNGSAGIMINAANNWFGCSGGPGTTGCDTAQVQSGGTGTLTTSPFLQLRTTASPATIVTGQTSALTASFLTNSAGSAIAAGNLGVLIGLPVTWSGVGGGISGAQTTIQAAGTATATYTATAVGAGSATAQVDGGPASGSTNTVAITVNQASTTTSITSDSPDPSNVGQNVTVNYSVAVTAPGGGAPTGNVMVSDGVNSCAGTVAAGSCAVALNTAGNRTLTATYQGDTNYAASPASAGAGHVVGTVTWSGASSAAYNTNGNWNTGLTPGSSDTVIIPTAGVTNNPTISAAASAAALTVQSGRALTNNGTLTVNGALTNNGTIMGTGTIANNFSNAGTLAPGLSPGVLNVTGTFANTGTINMEIGGAGGAGVNPNGHDQLVVSGAATLGGTLNVTLTNGFTPAPLNNFLLLNASTLSGTFATVNLPNIAPLV